MQFETWGLNAYFLVNLEWLFYFVCLGGVVVVVFFVYFLFVLYLSGFLFLFFFFFEGVRGTLLYFLLRLRARKTERDKWIRLIGPFT